MIADIRIPRREFSGLQVGDGMNRYAFERILLTVLFVGFGFTLLFCGLSMASSAMGADAEVVTAFVWLMTGGLGLVSMSMVLLVGMAVKEELL